MDNKWAGLANNTKWNELQQVMSELGQKAPYWRTRATNGFIYPTHGWEADWTYHFRLGEYKYIEWCEMLPSPSENALPHDEIATLCMRIGFETEILESTVKITGYRQLQ